MLFGARIDEGAFAEARSVADLKTLVDRSAEAGATTPAEPVEFPSWNRTRLAWFIRRISLPTWILPLGRLFVWLTVEGREHLAKLDRPVIFAVNHQSHLDLPTVLMALPGRLRYRVAPAMAKEFFKAHFFPEQFTRRAYFKNSTNYYLSSLFFNAFPLPQRESGTRQTLRYIGDRGGAGYSILIYPEGRRTQAGEIERFQPGAAMIAARLDIPVIPVKLEGLDRILHQSWKFPERGRASVTFGAPISLKGNDYAALSAELEAAVRHL